jgi:hypothetical protein
MPLATCMLTSVGHMKRLENLIEHLELGLSHGQKWLIVDAP